MIPERLSYAWLNHRDGTYDSICERCLRTIVLHRKPIEVRLVETFHHCGEEDLRQTLRELGPGLIEKQLAAILEGAVRQ